MTRFDPADPVQGIKEDRDRLAADLPAFWGLRLRRNHWHKGWREMTGYLWVSGASRFWLRRWQAEIRNPERNPYHAFVLACQMRVNDVGPLGRIPHHRNPDEVDRWVDTCFRYKAARAGIVGSGEGYPANTGPATGTLGV